MRAIRWSRIASVGYPCSNLFVASTFYLNYRYLPPLYYYLGLA